jgi:hypothetical protein
LRSAIQRKGFVKVVFQGFKKFPEKKGKNLLVFNYKELSSKNMYNNVIFPKLDYLEKNKIVVILYR